MQPLDTGDALRSDRLGRLLRALLWLGMALLLTGLALEMARHGALDHDTVPLSQLVPGLLALQGKSVLALGVLVFLVSPPLGLLYLTGSLWRAGDRRYALAAAVVTAIVLCGMVLAIP